jgi:MFS family permease
MTSPGVPILFGGLIAWSIYRRVRRNIGRQRLRPRRAVISIIVLTLVSALLLSASLQNSRLLLGIGGGLLLGVLLGIIGLRLTRFETTDEGHFYTPNAHIGVVISLLFIGRLAYRYWVTHDVVAAPNGPPPFQSSLTFFIFGLTAGYYIVYQAGLFKHSRDKNVPSQKSFESGVSSLESPRDRS